MSRSCDMTTAMKLVLASASPRRQELLHQIGVQFRVVNHSIHEARRPGEPAAAFVRRMAQEKALDVLSRLAASEPEVVLGADTVVVLDDQVLGKPVDFEDALRMLGLLSGREHQVLSAVAVCDRHEMKVALSVTVVRFRAIEPGEIAAYWQTGEPVDKAGAYAAQGHGAVFVEHLQGSFTGVVGLPLFETAALLASFRVRSWLPEPETGGGG